MTTPSIPYSLWVDKSTLPASNSNVKDNHSLVKQFKEHEPSRLGYFQLSREPYDIYASFGRPEKTLCGAFNGLSNAVGVSSENPQKKSSCLAIWAWDTNVPHRNSTHFQLIGDPSFSGKFIDWTFLSSKKIGALQIDTSDNKSDRSESKAIFSIYSTEPNRRATRPSSSWSLTNMTPISILSSTPKNALIFGISNSKQLTFVNIDFATNKLSFSKIPHIKTFNSSCHPIQYKDLILLPTYTGKVYIWSISQSKLSSSWNPHFDAISCMDIKNDILAIGSKDSTISIWNISNINDTLKFQPQKISSISRFDAPISAVALSYDAKYIAAGSIGRLSTYAKKSNHNNSSHSSHRDHSRETSSESYNCYDQALEISLTLTGKILHSIPYIGSIRSISWSPTPNTDQFNSTTLGSKHGTQISHVGPNLSFIGTGFLPTKIPQSSHSSNIEGLFRIHAQDVHLFMDFKE